MACGSSGRVPLAAGWMVTACPAPSGHPGQRAAGELPRLVITREGQGCDPHLPELVGSDMETKGL